MSSDRNGDPQTIGGCRAWGRVVMVAVLICCVAVSGFFAWQANESAIITEAGTRQAEERLARAEEVIVGLTSKSEQLEHARASDVADLAGLRATLGHVDTVNKELTQTARSIDSRLGSIESWQSRKLFECKIASNSVSTSSKEWSLIPDMELKVTPSTNRLQVLFLGTGFQGLEQAEIGVYFRLLINNTQVAYSRHEFKRNEAWAQRDASLNWLGSVEAGKQAMVRVEWRMDRGGKAVMSSDNAYRILSVIGQ